MNVSGSLEDEVGTVPDRLGPPAPEPAVSSEGGSLTAPTAPSPKSGEQSVATMGLVAGVLIVALTVVMGVTANSLAIWVDVVVSMVDTLAVFIAWLTTRAALRGRKESFHFGYGRLETFTSFGMGQLMLVSFTLIVAVVVWRLIHPVELHGFGIYLSVGGNVGFGLFNLYIYRRTCRLQHQNESPTLTAQRGLYLNKALSNVMFIVAFSAALAFRGHKWTMYIDIAVSFIIAADLLLCATKTMGWSALNLIDRSLEEHDQLLIIRGLVEHFDDFMALHDIRTRRSGRKRYIELYLEFEPDKPMGVVQDTIERLQARISELVGTAEVIVVPLEPRPPRASSLRKVDGIF